MPRATTAGVIYREVERMPVTATHARDLGAPQHTGGVPPTYHGLPSHLRGQQIKASPHRWLRTLLGLGDRVNDQEMLRAAAEEITRLRGLSTSIPERDDADRLGAEAEAPLRHGPPTKVAAKRSHKKKT